MIIIQYSGSHACDTAFIFDSIDDKKAVLDTIRNDDVMKNAAHQLELYGAFPLLNMEELDELIANGELYVRAPNGSYYFTYSKTTQCVAYTIGAISC